MRFDDIWERYRVWLLNKLGFHSEEHFYLTEALHKKDFKVLIRGDKNREEDGCIQREYFVDQMRYDLSDVPDGFWNVPASLLEVLVAFAIRVDREWIGDPSDPRPDRFFVEMLQNLNVFHHNDWNFDSYNVNYILDRWNKREFGFNGKGSILPLRVNTYHEDQRNREIWLQMTAYLKENYPMEVIY